MHNGSLLSLLVLVLALVPAQAIHPTAHTPIRTTPSQRAHHSLFTGSATPIRVAGISFFNSTSSIINADPSYGQRTTLYQYNTGKSPLPYLVSGANSIVYGASRVSTQSSIDVFSTSATNVTAPWTALMSIPLPASDTVLGLAATPKNGAGVYVLHTPDNGLTLNWSYLADFKNNNTLQLVSTYKSTDTEKVKQQGNCHIDASTGNPSCILRDSGVAGTNLGTIFTLTLKSPTSGTISRSNIDVLSYSTSITGDSTNTDSAQSPSAFTYVAGIDAASNLRIGTWRADGGWRPMVQWAATSYAFNSVSGCTTQSGALVCVATSTSSSSLTYWLVVYSLGSLEPQTPIPLAGTTVDGLGAGFLCAY